MLITDSKENKIEIKNCHWSLAEALFLKWGHTIDSDKIEVEDVNDITPELSAWGVPWKWN